MINKIFLFFALLCSASLLQAQDSDTTTTFPKNILDVSYTHVFEGNNRNGGNFTGGGIEIAYTRYFLKDRMYGRISYGKTYARTDDSFEMFWKDDHPIMSVFTLAVGYDFVKKRDFTLGIEAGFLNLRFESIDYAVYDHVEEEYDTISYGKFSDGTIFFQLRGRYYIGRHFMVTPAITYGTMYTKYETFWGKIGVGYRF